MSKHAAAPESGTLSDAEVRKLNFLGYKKAEALALPVDEARALLASNKRKPKVVVAQVDDLTGLPVTELLNRSELVALDLLGYQAEHIATLSMAEVTRIVEAKTYRPGSRAHNEANGSALPDKYTDDAIKEANATRPPASGTVIELDEYTQRCIAGDNPIDACLLDLESRFPGKRFRAIDPTLPQPSGPQFQQVYDDQGKKVTVGDLEVGFMPESVYEEAYVKPNLKRSQSLMGAVTQGTQAAGDSEAPVAPQDRHYAPVQGKGLTIAPNLANL